MWRYIFEKCMFYGNTEVIVEKEHLTSHLYTSKKLTHGYIDHQICIQNFPIKVRT